MLENTRTGTHSDLHIRIFRKLLGKRLLTTAPLLIAGVAFVIAINLYKNYLQMVDLTDSFVYHLIGDFVDNENIANTLSSRYLENLYTGNCPRVSPSRPPEDMVGKLITMKKANRYSLCLLAALEYIHKEYLEANPHDSKVRNQQRYFYSPQFNLLYFFNKQLNILPQPQDLQVFAMIRHYTGESPDFYRRYLSRNVHREGYSSSNIYTDLLTGEKAYTLVSYVYSLDRETILGYVFYDHTKSELRNTLANSQHGKLPLWLSAQIQYAQKKGGFCFLGNCEGYQIRYHSMYSDRYKVTLGIHPFQLIYHDPLSLLSLIVTLFLLVGFVLVSATRDTASKIAAITDPLTGVYTRSALRYLSAKKDAYLIVFDANKFKAINDTYGHIAGDLALKRIASRIARNVRASDAVIRTGGDEFIVYLKARNSREAQNIARRIAASIRLSPLRYKEHAITVSVSYGVAPFTLSLMDAIDAADRKMYEYKTHSR